jgi:hypothetical protein
MRFYQQLNLLPLEMHLHGRLDRNRISIVKHTHVQLTSRHTSIGPVPIDVQRMQIPSTVMIK